MNTASMYLIKSANAGTEYPGSVKQGFWRRGGFRPLRFTNRQVSPGAVAQPARTLPEVNWRGAQPPAGATSAGASGALPEVNWRGAQPPAGATSANVNRMTEPDPTATVRTPKGIQTRIHTSSPFATLPSITQRQVGDPSMSQRAGGWMAGLGLGGAGAARSAKYIGTDQGVAAQAARVGNNPNLNNLRRAEQITAGHQARLAELGRLGMGVGAVGAAGLGYGAYRMLRQNSEEQRRQEQMQMMQMMQRR